MPELITSPEDLQYIISDLEQKLANDPSVVNDCDFAYVAAAFIWLEKLQDLKHYIKDYIMLLSIDDKRDRLEYLLDGNKYYNLIDELNEYEQKVLTDYFNDFAKQLDMKLLESDIDLSVGQNQEQDP